MHKASRHTSKQGSHETYWQTSKHTYRYRQIYIQAGIQVSKQGYTQAGKQTSRKVGRW